MEEFHSKSSFNNPLDMKNETKTQHETQF